MTSGKNSILYEIGVKALEGEKIGRRDGIALMESDDLLLLGALADQLREKTAGDMVSFVSNLQINYTNICSSKCRFCAFHRDANSEDAYTLSVGDIVGRIKSSLGSGITEVHIVGGINPDLTLEYYENMLSEIKRNFPGIQVKAFTAVEVAFLAKETKNSVKEILGRFREAGLDCLPGGGAEILNDELREKLCPNKAKSSEWLDVMESAHGMGLKTNSTMLYGHIESAVDRVDHILKIRRLQEKTGGFQAFIPLSFQPGNTGVYEDKLVVNPPSGLDDLRVLAVSRILLNGFIDNIRAYWVMLGKKLAQASLNYGVNDLDGTVIEERIAHAAGGCTERCASVEELVGLISGAGRIPAQRTTDYKILKVWDS